MAVTTKTIAGDAKTLTGKTPEVNSFSANNTSLEAKERENALAAAMGRTAGASETTSEPKLDSNPMQGVDSPQVQQESKEIIQQKARIAQIEQEQEVFDATATKNKEEDRRLIQNLLNELGMTMKPEVAKANPELVNLTLSNHAAASSETRGNLNTKTHIKKAEIRTRALNLRYSAKKSSHWHKMTIGKIRHRKTKDIHSSFHHEKDAGGE